MLHAFYHEEAVKVGDEVLRLTLDFRALDAIESHTNRAFDEILHQLTARRAVPPNSLVARVVWGLLRTHHPEVDIDQAMGVVNGPSAGAVGIAMGTLFEKGFPRAKPGDAKAKPAHPRKPRGASKPSSSHGAAKD
ncbi:hypothetical protein U1872_12490 [Sphingomonas sp. RB3P16]|uniref:hypothetical protein n=1 Tax=Parasphingomonas frigoris TaxID=3096163 RepID=UPI002FC9382B